MCVMHVKSDPFKPQKLFILGYILRAGFLSMAKRHGEYTLEEGMKNDSLLMLHEMHGHIDTENVCVARPFAVLFPFGLNNIISATGSHTCATHHNPKIQQQKNMTRKR